MDNDNAEDSPKTKNEWEIVELYCDVLYYLDDLQIDHYTKGLLFDKLELMVKRFFENTGAGNE